MLRRQINWGSCSHFRKTRIWKVGNWKTRQPLTPTNHSIPTDSPLDTWDSASLCQGTSSWNQYSKSLLTCGPQRVPFKDALTYGAMLIVFQRAFACPNCFLGSMSISRGWKYWLNQALILLIFPLTNRHSIKVGKLVLPQRHVFSKSSHRTEPFVTEMRPLLELFFSLDQDGGNCNPLSVFPLNIYIFITSFVRRGRLPKTQATFF